MLIICVLNWMRNEHPLGVPHTQRFGLGLRGIRKFGRRNGNRRGALNLKPYRVMQTARGTRASVSQRLDNKVVGGIDFRTQRIGRRLGKRRLYVAGNFHLR